MSGTSQNQRANSSKTMALGKDMLPANRFAGEQRLHFLVCVVAPTVGTFLVPIFYPVVLSNLYAGFLCWLIMWFLAGGVGVSVGMHRHFSHRSFVAKPVTKASLGIFGCMAAQGPIPYWVALHRCHHAHSDEPGDPHSPHRCATGHANPLHAALHGHMGWVPFHDVPKPTKYARDLIEDPVVKQVSRFYWYWVLLGIAAPAATWGLISDSIEGVICGAYWGGLLRIALGHQLIWAVNSVCHLWGGRPNDVGNLSTNNIWIALLTWGEGWHNNHHWQPSAAQFSDRWWQVDVGWWVVQFLATTNLVSNIRQRRAE